MIDHADKSWLRASRKYPAAFDVIGSVLAVTSILAVAVMAMFL